MTIIVNTSLADKTTAEIETWPTLFKASENGGKMEITRAGQGTSTLKMPKASLDTDDCYIFPIADLNVIYVWTGVTTSGRERNNTVKMAIRIKKLMGSKSLVDVFPQGKEKPGFTQFFDDWENSNY